MKKLSDVLSGKQLSLIRNSLQVGTPFNPGVACDHWVPLLRVQGIVRMIAKEDCGCILSCQVLHHLATEQTLQGAWTYQVLEVPCPPELQKDPEGSACIFVRANQDHIVNKVLAPDGGCLPQKLPKKSTWEATPSEPGAEKRPESSWGSDTWQTGQDPWQHYTQSQSSSSGWHGNWKY